MGDYIWRWVGVDVGVLIVHRAREPVESERDEVALKGKVVEELAEGLVQVVLGHWHLVHVAVLQVGSLADGPDDRRGLPHPGQDLLENGHYVGVEVGLACQRVDDC